MRQHSRSKGFSFIELLLTLAIIGIVSAIAVPALLGSRQHARMVGDAKTNLLKLHMALGQYHTDNTVYPPVGTYTWTAAGARPANDPLPAFVVSGGVSKLDFTLVVPDGRQSYTITATDTTITPNVVYLVLDHNGRKI